MIYKQREITNNLKSLYILTEFIDLSNFYISALSVVLNNLVAYRTLQVSGTEFFFSGRQFHFLRKLLLMILVRIPIHSEPAWLKVFFLILTDLTLQILTVHEKSIP